MGGLQIAGSNQEVCGWRTLVPQAEATSSPEPSAWSWLALPRPGLGMGLNPFISKKKGVQPGTLLDFTQRYLRLQTNHYHKIPIVLWDFLESTWIFVSRRFPCGSESLVIAFLRQGWAENWLSKESCRCPENVCLDIQCTPPKGRAFCFCKIGQNMIFVQEPFRVRFQWRHVDVYNLMQVILELDACHWMNSSAIRTVK